MTETEAKTKWCPMVKTYGNDADVDSVGSFPSGTARVYRVIESETRTLYDPSRLARCIGSACMMWRWERESQHVDLVGDWAKKVSGLIEKGFDTFTFDRMDPSAVVERNTKHGYCGLAGKP